MALPTKWSSVVKASNYGLSPKDYEIQEEEKAKLAQAQSALRHIKLAQRSLAQGLAGSQGLAGAQAQAQGPELLTDPFDIPINYNGTPKYLPLNVHKTTADYAELFVYNYRNDLHELQDVASFKAKFNLFLIGLVNEKFGCRKKYKTSYNNWAAVFNLPNEDETTYKQWVDYMEKNNSTPWMNCMYNFVKQVTSDKCMYALSVSSGTFTTNYKSNLLDLLGNAKSGFLNVIKYKELGNQAPIHWFVTAEEMQSYKSVARMVLKTKQRNDDDDDDNYDGEYLCAYD
jgi:hypothetical protein